MFYIIYFVTEVVSNSRTMTTAMAVIDLLLALTRLAFLSMYAVMFPPPPTATCRTDCEVLGGEPDWITAPAAFAPIPMSAADLYVGAQEDACFHAQTHTCMYIL